MNPFLRFIADLRRGEALIECDAALEEMMRAVHEHRKPGKITLSITVKPATKIPGAVFITDKIAVVSPSGEQMETLLYTTPAGALSRRDPRQPDLPHVRPAGPIEVVVAEDSDPETGELPARKAAE
jgi:hypothetical protein